MRMKIVTAVGVTCFLAASCGSADSGSGSDEAGGKAAPTRPVLPQRLDQPDMNPDLEPDAPADDAPFAAQLEHELVVKTLDMARAEGTTTAKCPAGIEAKKGAEATCTSTYEGLKINWTVTFGDSAAWSDSYVEYDAKPSTGILTKAGVARLLFGNHKGYIDYALCNDIPEATLAPLDAKSTYECEVVDKGESPQGVTSTVRATEAGPRVY